MVTTNDVRDFVKSESYINLLNRTVLTLQLNFDDKELSSQACNIEAGRINKSNIGLDKLLLLCVEDVDKLIRYVELRLLILKKYDVYEFYGIERLRFHQNFLIGHLIEFFFLKNDPKGLDSYLKATEKTTTRPRIPSDLKKYAAELKDIYGQL